MSERPVRGGSAAAPSLAGAILSATAAGRLPGLGWLDGGGQGRSFLGAWPDRVVEGESLAALHEVEAAWRAAPRHVWIGWLSYELGAAHLRGRAVPAGLGPSLCLRRYPGALEWREGVEPRGHGEPAAVERLRQHLGAEASRTPSEPRWPLLPLRARLPAAEYRARVERARAYIAAGETYQINLSQPFAAPWRPDVPSGLARRVAEAYACLQARRPASMGALVEAGPGAFFISNSPETLLDLRRGAGTGGDDLARSWPIKGTRPRHADPDQDDAARQELWSSAKDRAEHLMIVDLVRNDLGRLARPGTVRAAPQPSPLRLPTVHHLVTEVRAELPPQTSLYALVEALFPGGSITGAPKRRTVELIETLEDHRRGIYCGAIVVLEPDGLRMSIPIRTGVLDAAGLTLCSGGGIVIDSEPEAERLETLAKTRAFGAVRPAEPDGAPPAADRRGG